MQAVLDRLATELGLDESLPKEDDLVWTIPLEDTSITVTDLSPGFYLYTELTELPKGAKENLMVLLSTCNLFGQRTDNCVVGLEENKKMLSLSLSVPEDFDYENFYNQLEDFINQMDFWKETVAQWSDG